MMSHVPDVARRSAPRDARERAGGAADASVCAVRPPDRAGQSLMATIAAPWVAKRRVLGGAVLLGIARPHLSFWDWNRFDFARFRFIYLFKFQPPSHVAYAGVVCGADGAILWHNFSVKDVRAGLNTTRCSFTCAASPAFCGPCGGPSPNVPTLPSHLCPAASNNGSGAGAAARVIAVAARVAGYDTALFGLPADGIAAILFEATDSALVATTSLSNVLQGRYVNNCVSCNAWRVGRPPGGHRRPHPPGTDAFLSSGSWGQAG